MEPPLATTARSSDQSSGNHDPSQRGDICKQTRVFVRRLWNFLRPPIVSLLIGILGSLIAAYIWANYLERVPPLSSPAPPASTLRIRITEIPHRLPSGETQPSRWIRGHATGLGDPRSYGVVLYVYTTEWYVVPKLDHPFTVIDPDGSWENYIEGGSYYAAFVVKKTPDIAEFIPPKDPLSLLDSDRWVTWQVVEGRSNFREHLTRWLRIVSPISFAIGWILRIPMILDCLRRRRINRKRMRKKTPSHEDE